MNIPLQDLPQRLGELGNYRECTVAIVCCTDKRSARAARLLAAAGFADAQVVRRGMTGWLEAGLPVIRERAQDRMALT